MSSIKDKTLENLEVGDIIISSNGVKLIVVVSMEGAVVVAHVNETTRTTYYYSVKHMIDNGWRAEKPLSIAEGAAKSLLEAIGFKVER